MYAAIDKPIDPYAAGIYRKMLKNELEYAENELCKHSSAYTLDASTGTVRGGAVQRMLFGWLYIYATNPMIKYFNSTHGTTAVERPDSIFVGGIILALPCLN
ncbi:hypothetical protein C8R45DRAFT_931990 [Mycena sanguinolenta]|nr:hypothetical protein C8R45DRAFT_931990 [Mycena sanguinolenta]